MKTVSFLWLLVSTTNGRLQLRERFMFSMVQNGRSCSTSAASQFAPVLLLQLEQIKLSTVLRPPIAFGKTCSGLIFVRVIVVPQNAHGR